jgi:glycerate 2-kinase
MRPILNQAFMAAVNAAKADCLVPYLQALPKITGETVVLVVGKAAASQAVIANYCLGSVRGLCIVPQGQSVNTSLKVIEATHPVPSNASRLAAQAAFELVKSLGPNDRLVCLISGGGSALMSAPLPNMPFDLKLKVHQELLASGATISELNTVRKQLSLVKGGRLAKLCAAPIENFLISDVPGDEIEFIASGPTVPAYTNQLDAMEVLSRYEIPSSEALRPWLTEAASAAPAPEDPCFERVRTTVVAAPSQSLKAAELVLISQGVDCLIMGDAVEGDSEIVARVMAQTALWQKRHGQLKRPLCLLSGGETTVRVTGDGVGGPNSHFALCLLDALGGEDGIAAIVCDTDGVDGAAEIAGAYLDSDTLRRAQNLGLDIKEAIKRQDAHSFFSALGQSVIPGPTGTNVNDFRAILIATQS